jgi:succinate dehydrogenase / fumarate reductase, membrane anchor subunit
MVKAYTKSPVGAHYGLGDWLLQRLTAVVMAVYTVVALGCIVWRAPASFADWKAMFAGGFFRLFTMLFFAALLYHAWVGMRDILMDYVKPTGLRLTLEMAVALSLLGYLIWSAAILWGLKP